MNVPSLFTQLVGKWSGTYRHLPWLALPIATIALSAGATLS
jgi:hypothetical protein